jgi:hypothetical protein
MSMAPVTCNHIAGYRKNPGDAAASNQAVKIGFLAYPVIE